MKQMIAIVDVIGREILDSRGNPTVEVEVILEVSCGTATRAVTWARAWRRPWPT